MSVQFRVGRIEQDIPPESESVEMIVTQLKAVLNGLDYDGSMRTANSNQLDIFFDEVLFTKLESNGWRCQQKPVLDTTALGAEWGRLAADAIIDKEAKDIPKVVLEIEKANIKSIWKDLIKIWMFIDSKQASLGLIMCPMNYAHTHGVWNPYQEAVTYKRYLEHFARVPKERLDSIGILGFEQLVTCEGKEARWDDIHFRRVKSTFTKKK